MRESGYYKVRSNDTWEVSYWSYMFHEKGSWLRCGINSDYYDSDFEAIDENRIAPEPNSFETKDFDLDTRI